MLIAQEDAAECVELGGIHEGMGGVGLPLAGHAGALSTNAPSVHAAVLCCALHAGMQALPELDAQQAETAESNDAGASTGSQPPPPSASKAKAKAKQLQTQPAGNSGAQAGSSLPSVRDMFLGLGGLQPVGAFDAHLSLLMDRALPDLQPRVAFLAALYALPEESDDGEYSVSLCVCVSFQHSCIHGHLKNRKCNSVYKCVYGESLHTQLIYS